ncbi:MAG: hypothetical protein ACOCWJ_02140 [Verrucomicrobiota bacterium]
MNTDSHPFLVRIAGWRRHWSRSEATEYLLYVAPVRIALALAALALLDLLLAWPAPVRLAVAALVGTGLLLWIFADLIRAMRKTAVETAAALDAAGAGARKRILTAYELLRGDAPAETEDGLAGYCIQRVVEKAGQALDALSNQPLQNPQRRLRRRRRLLQVAAGMVVFLLLPGVWTSARRTVLPWRDIPPWSRLAFHISPLPAKAVYGGSLEIAVEISGVELRDQNVELLTRDEDGTQASACFRAPQGSFTQQVQNVTPPLEFCFRAGRARSRWHTVEVLMRPRIEEAQLTIRPPAYTGRPSFSFPLGEGPLQALAGSTATLRIRSNRPLADGRMTLTTGRYGETEEVVAGNPDPNDDHSVQFRWTVTRDSSLKAVITGSDGLTATDTLVLEQVALPDRKPTVNLNEIPPFSLATPRAKIHIQSDASDDLAVRQLELIRCLDGFRDYACALGPANPLPEYTAEWTADLAALGVRDGDQLEFFAEARDTNPDRTGISNSDIARVQVISEDDYAAILRRRSSFEEFVARFSAAETQYKQLHKAVETLREAARKNTDAETLEGLRKAAAEQAAETVELFKTMAADFTIYDLEERLAVEMTDLLGDLKVVRHSLENTPVDHPNFRSILDHLAEEKLEAPNTAVPRLTRQAEEAVDIGNAFKAIGALQTASGEQQWLTRMISRAADGNLPDLPLLRNQAAPQKKVAKTITRITARLETLAARMPADYAPLAQNLTDTASALREAGIASLMNGAAEAAASDRGAEAKAKAAEALRRLRAILAGCRQEGNCVGEALNGNLGFCAGSGIQETIRQMLDSLRARGEGQGPNRGTAGAGAGGSAEDGYWYPGIGQRNVPMYGPERLSFRPSHKVTQLDLHGDEGRAAERGGGQDETAPTGEPMRPENVETADQSAQLRTTVHPSYREAIKRFFGDITPADKAADSTQSDKRNSQTQPAPTEP